MAITYDDIEQIMEAAERDARADVGEEFTDDMVVDLASSVLIGQPYSLVREWCRRNLGFMPASLRPVRRRSCSFPVLHSEATRLGRPLVCGCAA
jgi:hypothetical protein